MKLLQLDMNEKKSEREVYQYLMEQLELADCEEGDLDVLRAVLVADLQDNLCVEFTPCAKEAPLYEFSGRLRDLLLQDAETIEERDGRMYAVFAGKKPIEDGQLW